MSGDKRLNLRVILVMVSSLVFLGLAAWATRSMIAEVLVNPWREALAGQRQAPWAPTLFVTVLLVLFMSAPVNMLLSALRELRKSPEAIAGAKLRPVGRPPEAPADFALPYRGSGTSHVAERYRPFLATLPFPEVRCKPGRHLPFRLATHSSTGPARKTSSLVGGVVIGLVLLVISTALLRQGALSPAIASLVFLAMPIYLLWPWIRPLFSSALLDPVVEIDRDLVVAGESFRVWVGQPGPARVRRLTVRLLLTEHVSYQRGSSDGIDSRDVSEVQLWEEGDLEIPGDNPLVRSFEAVIPASSMHSFVSQNNRVEWAIRVEAEIEGWPDVKQTYPLAVIPPA